MADMFSNATAYEATMGRWSARLAPLFVRFAAIPDGGRVLDVGCGTGSLVSAVAAAAPHFTIVGIDQALPAVQYARTRFADPRITIEQGNALDLPDPTGAFHQTLSLLVLTFMPHPEQAVREMRRVTRPGGTVAACIWDSEGFEMNWLFWEVARSVEPASAARAERGSRFDQPGQLAALWQATGLEDVEESVLDMRTDFTSFDDYWQPLLHGSGSGPRGVYVAGLSPAHRDALRRALQARLQADSPDGGFSLRAQALAVRGVVPQVP